MDRPYAQGERVKSKARSFEMAPALVEVQRRQKMKLAWEWEWS